MRLISTSTKLDWIDLIISLRNTKKTSLEYIDRLRVVFGQVTVISPEETRSSLPDNAKWINADGKNSKVELWNTIVKESEKKWILFIEDDEEIDFRATPTPNVLNTKQWIPALITEITGEHTYSQEYQPRLVPKSEEHIFSGKEIPDATAFMIKNKVEFVYQPLRIIKENGNTEIVNPNEELSVKNIGPQVYFKIGSQYVKERKYVLAAAQYRRLTGMDHILNCDYLGALNGLASCYVESFKWEKAIQVAKQSLNSEPNQYMPYLIMYKIYELNKHWKDSLTALEDYMKALTSDSKASYDKYISQESALLKLGNLAIKSGLREKSLYYYDMYFTIKKGYIESTILNKMFMLSIELNRYDKAIGFFEEIFGNFLQDDLTKDKQNMLHEYLSMFMINGWYEFPHEIYQKLYEKDSQNREYKRKLIVTLSKTNQVDKAKQLIGQNV